MPVKTRTSATITTWDIFLPRSFDVFDVWSAGSQYIRMCVTSRDAMTSRDVIASPYFVILCMVMAGHSTEMWWTHSSTSVPRYERHAEQRNLKFRHTVVSSHSFSVDLQSLRKEKKKPLLYPHLFVLYNILQLTSTNVWCKRVNVLYNNHSTYRLSITSSQQLVRVTSENILPMFLELS